jgi:hypothetical protein
MSLKRRLRKKLRRQGAQILRSEAYFVVRRNDEGYSVTQHPDFLRSRHPFDRKHPRLGTDGGNNIVSLKQTFQNNG